MVRRVFLSALAMAPALAVARANPPAGDAARGAQLFAPARCATRWPPGRT